MITKIIIHMEDFLNSYPTGAVAYDGDDQVDSDYCTTVAEFTEFIDANADRIAPYATLEVNFNANDICGDEPIAFDCMMETVRRVTKHFRKVRDSIS